MTIDTVSERIVKLHGRISRLENTLFRIESLLCSLVNEDTLKGTVSEEVDGFKIELHRTKSGIRNVQPVEHKKKISEPKKFEGPNLFGEEYDDEIPF